MYITFRKIQKKCIFEHKSISEKLTKGPTETTNIFVGTDIARIIWKTGTYEYQANLLVKIKFILYIKKTTCNGK